MSYSRSDAAGVIVLERALQVRGVRVLRDTPSLPLGAENVAGLQQMIDQDCDAVLLYITPQLLASDFIWRYEIPWTLARQARDPRFRPIPVLQGVSYDELAMACADRGLRSLAGFNGVTIAAGVPSATEAREVARRALSSALAVRLERDTNDRAALGLCLRTFAYTPAAPALHLDLDWTAAFSDPGPTPGQWRDELLPAAEDVASIVASRVPTGTIDVWMRARLPAAVALGHAFPPKGPFTLRPRREDEAPTSAAAEAIVPLAVTSTRFKSSSRAAIVEVPVSREVAQDVTTWRQDSGLDVEWRIRCAPSEGASREAIDDVAQAESWARQVGDQIRYFWDKESVHDVHLFLASTSSFAALLGQQLRDRRPVHVYFGDNQTGYRLAYTLNQGITA